jgi:hypothetical protein
MRKCLFFETNDGNFSGFRGLNRLSNHPTFDTKLEAPPRKLPRTDRRTARQALVTCASALGLCSYMKKTVLVPIANHSTSSQ